MLSRLCIFALSAACLGGCDSKSQPKEIPGADVVADEKSTARKPSDSPKIAGEHPPTITPTPYNFLQAIDRSKDDLTLDKQRKPAEMLAFFGIQPKMRVAELAAGGGYTSELLARTVGPEGIVYGQNSPFILRRFAEVPWSERLKKPALKNVVRLDTEFEAPLPPSADNLDAVLMVLFYHDTVWFKTDREAMNKAVYQSLKPGGIFGIIDHHAKEGDGVSQAETLHRIEESVVVSEITNAGFILDDSASFLRNPNDPRDWNAAPSKAGEQRGTSDRFVLRFKKPDAAPSDAEH